MIRKILSVGAVSVSCIFPLQQSVAGPLTSAEVTKIINHVSVIDPEKGDRSALIRDVIKDDLGLQTGEKSRSELLFQDNTLTRIGAETFFSFKTGTRDMTLEKGSMLLQVPKGLGGAKIHTAAVTAAITGTTIMMEYFPGHHIKVLVLEGSLRLSRNGTFGDSLVLRPGKMVIMRPDAKKIPDPVDVDLAHIVKTSSLVNFPDSPPLPSTALIQAAIDSQAKQMAKSNLVPTNLVMGHGTDVILVSNDQLTRIIAPPRSPAGNVNGSPAGAPAAPATGPGGTLAAITAPLPAIGPVAMNPSVIPSNPVNNLLSPTGNIGPATIIPSNSVNNLLSSTGSIGPVTVIPSNPVNNLLSSTGNIGPVVNNLLGVNTTGTTTSISISSSTQLLGLLSNVAPAGGTITISPTALGANAHVTGPAGVLPSTTVTTGVVNVSTGGGTVNVGVNLPLNINNSLPIAPGVVPPLTPPLLNNTNPAGIVTTVTSVPTTLGLGTVAAPGSTPGTLPPLPLLGLGHH